MPHKLIIFEDNARLRQSLELLLNDEKTFRVMASYPDCRNAIEAIEETAAELIVMDIDMPGMNGVGVKMIKSTYPDVKVVMHTVFDDDTRIFDSICAGADGYLLKNTSPLQLIKSGRSDGRRHAESLRCPKSIPAFLHPTQPQRRLQPHSP